ncbi:unnamed protein product [Ixodes persulcatus]
MRRSAVIFDQGTSLLDIFHVRDEDFRRQFRFEKADLGALLSTLEVLESFTSAQGVVVPGDEALCIMLRRLAYPKWTLAFCIVLPFCAVLRATQKDLQLKPHGEGRSLRRP